MPPAEAIELITDLYYSPQTKTCRVKRVHQAKNWGPGSVLVPTEMDPIPCGTVDVSGAQRVYINSVTREVHFSFSTLNLGYCVLQQDEGGYSFYCVSKKRT